MFRGDVWSAGPEVGVQLGAAALTLPAGVGAGGPGDAVCPGAGLALPPLPAPLPQKLALCKRPAHAVLAVRSVKILQRVRVAEQELAAQAFTLHPLLELQLPRVGVTGGGLPAGEGGVGQVADGEQVVLRGHCLAVAGEVQRVGLVQVP